MKLWRNEMIAAISGLMFGVGLNLSEMVNPVRVLGFLDLFGAWDPTLAFVMGGALLVTVPGFAFARNRLKPLFALEYSEPTSKLVDRKLVTGAVLFGAGWGLAGLCPGPAIVNIGSLHPQALLFVVSMLAGMFLFRFTSK
jgi:uncharacterized membrane protein YedE/YeeE